MGTLSIHRVGVINNVPVLEVTYPASWKEAYKSGSLLARWRKEKPGVFDEADSGMTGSRDLFAQSCLAYALSEQGYRSTMWYKLALEPAKAISPDSIRARQRLISDRVGAAQLLALRQELLAEGLSNFKGEPDLFCWGIDPVDWFFAEAKDQDTKDGIHFDQFRWLVAARKVLGDAVPFRVYGLRAVPEPH